MNIRVLLVEDFPLVREGVAAALERDPAITVVGEAANGREGLEKAHELRPDVVLLDLHMPELGGMMLLERLRSEMPGVRTIVMTASEKGEPLLDAVAAGASARSSRPRSPATCSARTRARRRARAPRCARSSRPRSTRSCASSPRG